WQRASAVPSRERGQKRATGVAQRQTDAAPSWRGAPATMILRAEAAKLHQSEGSPREGAGSPPAPYSRPWRGAFEPHTGHAGEGTGKAICPNASAPEAREPDDEQAYLRQGCCPSEGHDRPARRKPQSLFNAARP